MLKAKFYFEDLANLKKGEDILKEFDYLTNKMTIVDADERNFTISATFAKTEKMDFMFINYFARPIKIEITE